MPRCKANTKKKGERGGKRCRRAASKGYKVCAMHGGKTPKGFDSVHTTHGRYIKDAPQRLLGRYEDAINDPQIVDLKAEMALVSSLIGEMLDQFESERYGSIWDDVRKARNDINRAMKTGDVQQMIDAYNYLDSSVDASYNEQETRDNLVKLIEQYRKLVESQHKLQTDADKLITIEDLTHSVMRLTAIIKDHVTDRKILAAINTDIREYMNAN